MKKSTISTSLFLFLCLLYTNCTETPTPEFGELVLVSGNMQSSDANTVVNSPLVVKVLDMEGNSLPGYPVQWIVEHGDGSFENHQATTDDAGSATAHFKTGATKLLNIVSCYPAGMMNKAVEFHIFKNPVFGTMTDPSTGFSYKTVTIDGTEWMAENLKVKENAEGTLYYEDIDQMYFLWKTAMGTADQNEITEPHQGVCPVGWHIPSLDECLDLSASVKGNALLLKAQPQGTNQSGFNVKVPNIDKDWTYYTDPEGNMKHWAMYWTSSNRQKHPEVLNTDYWKNIMGFSMEDISKIWVGEFKLNDIEGNYSLDNDDDMAQIRCIKD